MKVYFHCQIFVIETFFTKFLKSSFSQGLTLKGWIELMSGREAKKAIKFFEDALA